MSKEEKKHRPRVSTDTEWLLKAINYVGITSVHIYLSIVNFEILTHDMDLDTMKIVNWTLSLFPMGLNFPRYKIHILNSFTSRISKLKPF